MLNSLKRYTDAKTVEAYSGVVGYWLGLVLLAGVLYWGLWNVKVAAGWVIGI